MRSKSDSLILGFGFHTSTYTVHRKSRNFTKYVSAKLQNDSEDAREGADGDDYGSGQCIEIVCAAFLLLVGLYADGIIMYSQKVGLANGLRGKSKGRSYLRRSPHQSV